MNAAASPVVAIVTGAGSGIGRAVALALAQRRVTVLAVGRRAAPLHETAAAAGANVLPIACDVADPAGRTTLARLAQDAGGVRYVVHAAGLHRLEPLLAITRDNWRTLMHTNVEARLFLTLELLPVYDSGARVLFVGSNSASRARVSATAYCVSQAASTMLARCLTMELAARGVAVTSAIPSPARTPMVDQQMAADPALYPDALLYRRYREEGKLIAAAAVGKFFSWLLLDLPAGEFSSRDWNIAEGAHHPEWLVNTTLYDQAP
ncbi:MAG: SDR family oxidoreductase [Betaproteobacteria bacterium]|nr:SDR family oxidoreductase [Betaproteobacteria bacterium]